MIVGTHAIWQRQFVLTERQAEVARIEVENRRLKRQLEEIQSQEFLEKEARNTLGLVKPGEVEVIISSPAASPSGAVEAGDLSQVPEAGWRAWWKLFF